MKALRRILFFGELAPAVVHGISLSNRLNIDLLKQHFEIHIVEEKTELSEHKQRSGSKISRGIRDIREVFRVNKRQTTDYFYTVFSLSTFGSLRTLIALVAYRLSSAGRTVLHLHRGDFGVFYRRSVLNRIFAKLIFRLADTLIVLSEGQKKQMSAYFESVDISVLENSLNAEYEFDQSRTGNTNFLFVSNYIEEKGVYELLDVFQANPDLKLKCFGGFVNNQAMIEAYASDTISVGGFISGEEKFEQIHRADALILPSWNEGQPTIILEAMMVGTLVITSNVGLIEEMLGADYPFYFEAQNRSSLQACIDKFKSYADKESLSFKLKQKYAEEFGKSTHERKLLDIFF